MGLFINYVKINSSLILKQQRIKSKESKATKVCMTRVSHRFTNHKSSMRMLIFIVHTVFQKATVFRNVIYEKVYLSQS